MKTKLKVGDKVYDSALFGDLEGEVKNINKLYNYPISVKFGEQIFHYTINGSLYDTSNPTLSMQPYDKLSDIVPVWEEEEVWGLFWDDDKMKSKVYGQMVKSGDKYYPYFCIGRANYRYFKETGKLI